MRETQQPLTASETAELEILKRQAQAGRIAHGTPAYARYIALVGKSDTPPAPAPAPAPVPGLTFRNDEEAAKYYGIAWRTYMDLKKMGRDHLDPIPATRPDQMVAWFTRQQAAGRRKHRIPDTILQRAAEYTPPGPAAAPVLPTPPPIVEKPGDHPALDFTPPAPAAAPVPVPLPPPGADLPQAEETTTEQILSGLRRRSTTLTQNHSALLTAGRYAEAATIAQQLDRVNEDIRKWSASLKRIREGDEYVHIDSVQSALGALFPSFFRILDKELTSRLPPAEVRTALREVERRLPTLLPEELNLIPAPAA